MLYNAANWSKKEYIHSSICFVQTRTFKKISRYYTLRINGVFIRFNHHNKLYCLLFYFYLNKIIYIIKNFQVNFCIFTYFTFSIVISIHRNFAVRVCDLSEKPLPFKYSNIGHSSTLSNGSYNLSQ